MAAFIAAAAGACSPACAAALAGSPLSVPIMAALGIATAVGLVFSGSQVLRESDKSDQSDDSHTSIDTVPIDVIRVEDFL